MIKRTNLVLAMKSFNVYVQKKYSVEEEKKRKHEEKKEKKKLHAVDV